jgi:hypothetical protein
VGDRFPRSCAALQPLMQEVGRMPGTRSVEAPSALGHVPEHLGVERAPEVLLGAGLADGLAARRAAAEAGPPQQVNRYGNQMYGTMFGRARWRQE